MTERPRLHVLLIEDNAADVFLLQEALSAHAFCTFTVIGNGDRAFQLLREGGPGLDVPPDLVVLDMNLPGRDGVEVLRLIRSTEEIRDVVVAVVSSSPTDVMQRKTAQADCYITKPSDLDKFLAIGKELIDCVRRAGRSTAAN